MCCGAVRGSLCLAKGVTFYDLFPAGVFRSGLGYLVLCSQLYLKLQTTHDVGQPTPHMKPPSLTRSFPNPVKHPVFPVAWSIIRAYD